MARYSKALWRPLGGRPEPRLVTKNKVILHTMVGSLWGTDSFFRDGGYSGVESHFGTDVNEILQWQDTNYQADAQLEGNDDCISIETADHGPAYGPWSGPANVPPWTPAHLEINAQLTAWVCRVHNIPEVLIEDSRHSTRGIGTHRLGIDPYRDEGEHYSNHFAKACPGDARQAQMPELVARVQEINNEGDWLEMASQQEVEEAVVSALGRSVRYASPYLRENPPKGDDEASTRWLIEWNGQFASGARANSGRVMQMTAELIGQVAALSNALQQHAQATGAPLDLAAVQQAAERGTMAAWERVRIEFTEGNEPNEIDSTNK